MGVDFGPYLARVLHDVKMNWYNLIPEAARAPLMKKGKVSIEFAILKDGRIAGMQLNSRLRAMWRSTAPPGAVLPVLIPSRLCPASLAASIWPSAFTFTTTLTKRTCRSSTLATTPGNDPPSPSANPPCSEMPAEIRACLRPRRWCGTCPENAGRRRPAFAWFRRGVLPHQLCP